MLNDYAGGVTESMCLADKDLPNRLTDICSCALSGVEIIISQQVELSTVTFATEVSLSKTLSFYQHQEPCSLVCFVL